MEQVRDARLDELCELVGELRDGQADLRRQEDEALGEALERMRQGDRHVYRQAGVEMARISGLEHLRVRKVPAEKVSAPIDKE